MIVSADLHPETKSRPLYRPATPDPTARLHLIVIEAATLDEDVASRFAAFPTEIWGSGLAGLAERLADERTGLRLLAIGAESFVWSVSRVAQAAGLGTDEVTLHPTSQTSRQVQCLHCKTFIEGVTERVITCPGCHLTLLVRDHFSRRLAAFQAIATHGATRGEASR